MAERLKAPVLKTGNGVTRSGVRIPLSPPFINNFHQFRQSLLALKNMILSQNFKFFFERILNKVQYHLLYSRPTTWDEFRKFSVKKLHAGRITRPKNFIGYIGLTPFIRFKNHIRHDLTQPFPLEDNCIDFFHSEDVFEHIPMSQIKSILDEIYRVLKPNALLRVALPDYGSDIYSNRCIRNKEGEICFDPDGGGRFINGEVVEGGHLWFPKYELVRDIIAQSKFDQNKVNFLHYYGPNGSTTNPIDYNLGHVLRTPDHDERAQNPRRALSLVVDLRK